MKEYNLICQELIILELYPESGINEINELNDFYLEKLFQFSGEYFAYGYSAQHCANEFIKLYLGD